MTEEVTKPNVIGDTDGLNIETTPKKKSLGWAYVLGIFGFVATILMAVAVIYYNEELNELQHWGYL